MTIQFLCTLLPSAKCVHRLRQPLDSAEYATASHCVLKDNSDVYISLSIGGHQIRRISKEDIVKTHR